MATKKTTKVKKATPAAKTEADYVQAVEDAAADLTEFEERHAAFVEDYRELLLAYQTAADDLKRYCVENFDRLAGKNVGILKVNVTRKADPVAFRALVKPEIADNYIIKKEVLTLQALELGIQKGDFDESILDDVTSTSPQITGMPDIKLKH